MGAAVTNDSVTEEFEAKLQDLLAATHASRVTVRLDLPQHGFHVNDVAAEARQARVASLKGQTSIDQRRAATVVWLDRERKILVQEDLTDADPAPPTALVEIYGTLAQMLAPIVPHQELTGWVSVHHNRGRRKWAQSDIEALAQTADWFTNRLRQI